MTHGSIRAVRSANTAREAESTGQRWEECDTRHGTQIDGDPRPERSWTIRSLGRVTKTLGVDAMGD